MNSLVPQGMEKWSAEFVSRWHVDGHASGFAAAWGKPLSCTRQAPRRISTRLLEEAGAGARR